jgi:hypothetical protein
LSAERTNSALLLLRRSFVRSLPFAARVGLELDAYLIGEESPTFARDALGVRSPSVAAPLTDDGGLLVAPFALLAPPCAGDDWKKRGDDAAACDDRGPRRGVPFVRGVRREFGEDMIAM